MDISRSYYFCTHEQGKGVFQITVACLDATIFVHMNTGVFQLTVASYVRKHKGLNKNSSGAYSYTVLFLLVQTHQPIIISNRIV
jgi:hypothetical protein